MSTTTPILTAGQFRPASSKDFGTYAKHLGRYIGLGYQQAQETLACVYGYANAHELQQVLAKKGVAGPFDDQQAIPIDVIDARNARALDLIQARLQELGLDSADDPALEHKLIALSLFSSPARHRQTYQWLTDALPAEPYVKGPALEPPSKRRREELFKALYEPQYAISKGALARFELTKHVDFAQGQPSFDPHEQAQEHYQYRRPAFYLLTAEPVSEHPDLPEWEDFWDFWDGTPNFPGQAKDFAAYWLEHVVGTLAPKYLDDAIQDALGDNLSDVQKAEIAQFLFSPSEDAAKANPVLSRIPTILEVAHLWEPYRLQQFAKKCIERAAPLVVLQDGAWAPEFTSGKFKGQQFAWSIALRAGASLGFNEMADMSIWEYSATFMLCDQGGGRARPVALMSGVHIVPFKGEYAVSAEDFAENMDDYSAFLNKVWKELHFKWFSTRGYDSVADFIDAGPDDAITTVEMEITPELRGMGLASRLLNWFRATLQAYPTSLQDSGWDVVGTEDDDADRFDEDRDFDLGTPSVFVLPVAGTRPQRSANMVGNMSLARSPRKVQVAHKNPEDELRKEKLTAHFLAMADTVDADIVVFDPWEYPQT